MDQMAFYNEKHSWAIPTSLVLDYFILCLLIEYELA